MHRASVFLRHLVEMSNRACLNSEVVLVEWNPPPNLPRVRTTLKIPDDFGGVIVRVIVVPLKAHRHRANSVDTPFIESVAKNVGLRRARGEFILITNPDVLFTPEVYEFLTAQPLDRAALYRMDRYDVGADLPEEATVEEDLAFCRAHVSALHAMHAKLTYDRLQNADALLGARTMHDQLLHEYQHIIECPSYKSPHEKTLIFPVDGIHTNASGCFLLMHASAWEKINGHAEFIARGHADSVTCWSALSAGQHQVILEAPCRMFHLPHGRGQSSQMPQNEWQPWYQRFLLARCQGQSMLINDEHWGLAGWQFEEWEVHGGANQTWKQTAGGT